MRFGRIKLFCPICGRDFYLPDAKGTYHMEEWGHVCSRECYDAGEMKYVRMIMGKDEERT